MKVIKEEFFVPMVKLASGDIVRHDRSLDRPYRPARIDHYRSLLLVEIEGREAHADVITAVAQYDAMNDEASFRDLTRRALRNAVMALIERELFGN